MRDRAIRPAGFFSKASQGKAVTQNLLPSTGRPSQEALSRCQTLKLSGLVLKVVKESCQYQGDTVVSIMSLINRTLPSARQMMTPPACVLRRPPCVLDAPVQQPMP